MKKCLKCNLVFQTEDRNRCLYCSALLVSTSETKTAVQDQLEVEGNALIEQVVQDRRSLKLSNVQYIIGSYFRAQTFTFMYSFCRSEYRISKRFKRLLVQPVNTMSLLILPWVALDLVDTLWIRLMYRSHCTNCNWKYSRFLLGKKCSGDVCDYHREYTTIIEQILSGHITQTEDRLQKEALIKQKLGKKSAYLNFCRMRRKYDTILDVACVWFSCCLLCYFVIWISYPITVSILNTSR